MIEQNTSKKSTTQLYYHILNHLKWNSFKFSSILQVFLGIPYAERPKRFSSPVEKALPMVFNATTYGYQCPDINLNATLDRQNGMVNNKFVSSQSIKSFRTILGYFQNIQNNSSIFTTGCRQKFSMSPPFGWWGTS